MINSIAVEPVKNTVIKKNSPLIIHILDSFKSSFIFLEEFPREKFNESDFKKIIKSDIRVFLLKESSLNLDYIKLLLSCFIKTYKKQNKTNKIISYEVGDSEVLNGILIIIY